MEPHTVVYNLHFRIKITSGVVWPITEIRHVFKTGLGLLLSTV